MCLKLFLSMINRFVICLLFQGNFFLDTSKLFLFKLDMVNNKINKIRFQEVF